MTSMKNVLLFLTLFAYSFSFSQDYPSEPTKEDTLRIEKQLKKEADSVRQVLEKEDYLTESIKKIELEFRVDTFIVERRCALFIEVDDTDLGMQFSNGQLWDDYEDLLNKYYKLLIAKLNAADKETLKVSQRNWLKYRDSDQQVNFLLTEERYSGGGTIQALYAGNRTVEITKTRVIELYNYLQRASVMGE
jgi:uncharacterized protein YecT (DUF1311 family)